MAARKRPTPRSVDRDELKRRLQEPSEPTLGMMPMAPGEVPDLRGVFRALKSFRSKFPQHAGELIARVQKTLGATDEEMAAGMKVRPRNDWPEMADVTDEAFQAKVQTRSMPDKAGLIDTPHTDVGHIVKMPPQEPNAARAAQAPIKAAEKVIRQVESVLKKVKK